MRRSILFLLGLLLSTFFLGCQVADYYPSKVAEYLPQGEGQGGEPARIPGGPGADTAGIRKPGDTAVEDTATADTAAGTPADTTRPAGADTTLPRPADTTKPADTAPADTVKPADTVQPADTAKPVVARPADTVKVDTVKVDTVKADTAKADTVPKPKPLPVDTLRPTLPVDTAKPALPAPNTLPPLLRADLEDAVESCWGARGSSGYSLASCGSWSQIGSHGSRLAVGKGRGGSNALSVTFSANEEVAGASLPVRGDTVNVRAWYNFSDGFDFGQGVKIGRISSFNEATQMNDIDIIMTVRSAGGVNQCGLTPMSDLGLFFNGRPAGYDWGAITAPRPFQRNTWHSLEYQVALNTPGRSDGSVTLWVDGVLAAQKKGLNIRGNGGSSVKLNRLRIGGWYSNSAGGNSCANPSQPSTMLIDDVAVGKGYIGLD